MDSKEIGKRIKQRRQELEISVMDLVDITGLSKATLHRYESGDVKNIKRPVLESIANVLGVSPDWLMGLSDIQVGPEHIKDLDLNAVLRYVFTIISNKTAHNKGTQITDSEFRYLELGVALLLAILDDQLEKEEK